MDLRMQMLKKLVEAVMKKMIYEIKVDAEVKKC